MWDSGLGKFDLGYWISPNVITNTLGGWKFGLFIFYFEDCELKLIIKSAKQYYMFKKLYFFFFFIKLNEVELV